MQLHTIQEELKGNEYPGRGIVVGTSEDGKSAVAVYFIMGRSENSRNRIFTKTPDGIRTEAFDPSKLEDPSLIIYSPVRKFGDTTIVTNGDQTDTIYDGLKAGNSFALSLESRAYEPDAPNFTPRISAVIKPDGGTFSCKMSILKSDKSSWNDSKTMPPCTRVTYSYEMPAAGTGRFIHTYEGNGNPLPTFSQEPTPVLLSGDIDTLTATVWNALNEENKISLFVRFIDLASGKESTKIINKHC